MPEKEKPYAMSRLMRRCGELNIAYDKVIGSKYAKEHKWKESTCRIKYRDGKNGTMGWGAKTRLIEPKDTTPHSLEQMMSLLSSSEPAD